MRKSILLILSMILIFPQTSGLCGEAEQALWALRTELGDDAAFRSATIRISSDTSKNPRIRAGALGAFGRINTEMELWQESDDLYRALLASPTTPETLLAPAVNGLARSLLAQTGNRQQTSALLQEQANLFSSKPAELMRKLGRDMTEQESLTGRFVLREQVLLAKTVKEPGLADTARNLQLTEVRIQTPTGNARLSAINPDRLNPILLSPVTAHVENIPSSIVINPDANRSLTMTPASVDQITLTHTSAADMQQYLPKSITILRDENSLTVARGSVEGVTLKPAESIHTPPRLNNVSLPTAPLRFPVRSRLPEQVVLVSSEDRVKGFLGTLGDNLSESLLASGRKQMDDGDNAGARIIYEEYLSLFPSGSAAAPALQGLLGTFVTELPPERFGEGIANFLNWSRATLKNPATLETAELFSCQAHYKANEHQAALAAIGEFRKRFPKSKSHAGIDLLEGLVYLRLERQQDAFVIFRRLSKKNVMDKTVAEKALFLIGWSHLTGGEKGLAAEQFALLVKRYPEGTYAEKARAFLLRLQPEPAGETRRDPPF